ncbi:GNAT family acetyltransferase [Lysinibacillus sphaericus]|uniref:GNAT family N-acetyltransferase n=1 Tax=Lysinibacillus sphaericus TaxID=1421 RepID=UPI0018CCBDA6|nr:GNAT family N-acetyltransferase [Lysinibacillus sphaericus]MBG9453230.1 GNAT family acetyltransferase [Lysinibacillus sphaericus]MBG9476084.1 GNAT family acetyltransferase [Lysinibacillus sphaericus]MBG9591933.1 GNAT family acetyltransferase [Lysinibacillus sphaericus]
MNIKVATLEDIPQIEILYEELFLEMSKLQPKYIAPAKQDVGFLTNTISEEKSDIFVAEIDNSIAGFLLIQELTTPPYSCIVQHNYAYIMDVIVGEQYQSKGIGSVLLQEAKKWAKERKLDHLELSVLAENSGAFALYKRHGYKEASRTMRLEL